MLSKQTQFAIISGLLFLLIYGWVQARLLDTVLLVYEEQRSGLGNTHLNAAYRALRHPAIEWINATIPVSQVPADTQATTLLTGLIRFGPFAACTSGVVRSPHALMRIAVAMGTFIGAAFLLRPLRIFRFGKVWVSLDLATAESRGNMVRCFQRWALLTYVLMAIGTSPLAWGLFFDRSWRDTLDTMHFFPAPFVSVLAALVCAVAGRTVGSVALRWYLFKARQLPEVNVNESVCCRYCGHGLHGVPASVGCPECGPDIRPIGKPGLWYFASKFFMCYRLGLCVIATFLIQVVITMRMTELPFASDLQPCWQALEEWGSSVASFAIDYQETRWPVQSGTVYVKWPGVEAVIANQQRAASGKLLGVVACTYASRSIPTVMHDTSSWEIKTKVVKSGSRSPVASFFLDFGHGQNATVLFGEAEVSRRLATIGGRAQSSRIIMPGDELAPLAAQLQSMNASEIVRTQAREEHPQ